MYPVTRSGFSFHIGIREKIMEPRSAIASRTGVFSSRENTTVRGVISLLQEWTLLGGYPNLGLTFRYQRDDEEDNSFAGIKEDKFCQQQILRVDRTIRQQLSANAEVIRMLCIALVLTT